MTKLIEVGIAYPLRILPRSGHQWPKADPCLRCGAFGNHVERANGRATIVCDGCGKHAPIIFS